MSIPISNFPPRFVDDPDIEAAIHSAAAAAADQIAEALPTMNGERRRSFESQLRANVSQLLTARADANDDEPLLLGPDAFGDRFDLSQLPLARPGTGYAVQQLDTDTLLDRATGELLPVRDAALAGLFDTFDAAYAAARHYLLRTKQSLTNCPLAIVPAYFDQTMQRHVLIYGVLTRSP